MWTYKYYWSQIYIELRVRRAVDYHRSKGPVHILRTIVRMVPRSAIQFRFESISKVATRRDWALLNRWHSIIPRGIRLEKAMPVHRGALFWCREAIPDRD